MKTNKHLQFLALCIFMLSQSVILAAFNTTKDLPNAKAEALKAKFNKGDLSSGSFAFTENKGQVVDQNYQARPDVLFGGQNKGLTFHLRNNGISYQLYRVESWKEEENHKTNEKRKVIDQQTIYRIDINWLNANTDAHIQKTGAYDGVSHFYTEGCPEGGALNVKSYKEVTYQSLYTGIDLKWYEKNGELKYDYLCAAGSDYKQIQLQLQGAEHLSINNKGELLIKTPLGTILEKAPLVIQQGRELKSKWILKNNILSFEIHHLNQNLPYVIDPAVRVWGTYYGGAGNDYGYYCATDGSGNVYLAGYTASNTGTIIATTGAHQSTFGGGYDAFLVKLNASGVRQWGTYYGGAGIDVGNSCAADGSGNVYLAGYAQSNTGTIIATAGSHQSTNAGGFHDAFLVKFNASGVRQWGTYYGGAGNDYGNSCAADGSGNVYLVGETSSNTGTIIATAGAHQSTFGGTNDAFLVKFNSSGVRQWGTYYGGAMGDGGYSCATDGSGNVYLAGYTQSNTGTIIATAGSHQSTFGGTYDAFLVKFNGAGLRLWGTYYGGAGDDYGYSCATDGSGNVYLAGYTSSNTGTSIATAGAHQSTFGGGSLDAFLVKLNASGLRQWGTYYGGAGDDYGYSCATDGSGNAYLAGYTASNTGTIIATAGAHQSTFGGASDAFLVEFNASGLRQWGTYYGGVGFDEGYSCATDGAGNVYLAGYTTSNTGTSIATAGAHQSTYGGATYDAFLVKFKDCVPLTPQASVNATICLSANIQFSATVSGTATPSYSWTGPNTFSSTIQNPSIANAGTAHIGVYTLTVINNTVCVETTTTQLVSIISPPNLVAGTTNTSICPGQQAFLSVNGALSYTWNTGSNLSIIAVSPTITTSYTVIGTAVDGCTNTAVVIQVVDPCTGINSRTLNQNGILVYPNPSTGVFSLQIPNEMSILLTDALGKIIISEKVNSGNYNLNISEQARGIYFLKAIHEGQTKTIKLIKE